jgi:hypothetical protein
VGEWKASVVKEFTTSLDWAAALMYLDGGAAYLFCSQQCFSAMASIPNINNRPKYLQYPKVENYVLLYNCFPFFEGFKISVNMPKKFKKDFIFCYRCILAYSPRALGAGAA